MTDMDLLLARNARLVSSGGSLQLTVLPPHKVILITCLDPRVDPAGFPGVRAGDVMQVRNAGARVTDSVLHEIALIAELAALMVEGDAPLFEVAVVHHTECGTGFLADGDFRRTFSRLTGRDEESLEQQAVLDPEATVLADVALVHASQAISSRVTVSGHVHDLATGLVRTVAPAQPRGGADATSRGRASRGAPRREGAGD